MTDSPNITSVAACYMFPDSSAKCTSLVVMKNLSSSLSVLGALTTLAVIVIFRKYKDFSQRLIANLSVSALLHASSMFVTQMNDTATAVCIFQGAFLMFAIAASCLWVVAIMLNLYWIVMRGNSLKDYEIPLFIICWALALLFMALPFFGNDVYGPAGVWCWMRNKWEWRFGVWYILRIISVIVFIIVIAILIYHIKKVAAISRDVTDANNLNEVKDDIKTLRWYPLVYFVMNIFSIINRIQNAVDGSQSQNVFVLVLLQTSIGPLFGAVLALVFLLDPHTRKLLRRKKIKEALQNYCKQSSDIYEYPSEMDIVSRDEQ